MASFDHPHDPMAVNLQDKLLPPFWMEGRLHEIYLARTSWGWICSAHYCRDAHFADNRPDHCRHSLLIGTTLGLLAGYYRGVLDNVLARFADLLLSFPVDLLPFYHGHNRPRVRQPGVCPHFQGLGRIFRLVRGDVIAEKTKEYVEAARALGQSHFKIMVKEILPNIMNSIIVLSTLRMGFMIIMEASLSFLGLGIQYPEPAWGSMVNIGRNYMLNAWWISTFSGLAILILVLGINMLGEGLRDILDPRLKQIE